MSQELNTERQGAGFEIENSYNSEALYALLTKDHLAHEYTLQTNWKKVAVPGYDPVIDVIGIVGCDLKARYTGSGNRLDKVYWFCSDFELPYRLWGHDSLWAVASNLQRLGMSVTKVGHLRLGIIDLLTGIDFGPDAEETHLKHMFYEQFYTSKLDHSSTLGLSLIPPVDNVYKIRTVLPWIYGDLNNLNEFARTQESFIQNTEKVIKAIYMLDKKDLPPVKLQFKPEQEKSKEFIAECDYCGSNYFTAQGLTCPHCGASSPIFSTKEE